MTALDAQAFIKGYLPQREPPARPWGQQEGKEAKRNFSDAPVQGTPVYAGLARSYGKGHGRSVLRDLAACSGQ